MNPFGINIAGIDLNQSDYTDIVGSLPDRAIVREAVAVSRVYDNSKAREVLDWQPKYTFNKAIERLSDELDYRSELTHHVGVKFLSL